MSRVLLWILGVFHFLFGLLHLWMANRITVNENIIKIIPLMEIFAIWSCLTMFFIAFISLFCQRDILTTKMGKAALIFISMFYLIRAFEEYLFAFKGSLVMIIPCIIVALLNILILFLPYKEKKILSD
jgi:hypothetical protein